MGAMKLWYRIVGAIAVGAVVVAGVSVVKGDPDLPGLTDRAQTLPTPPFTPGPESPGRTPPAIPGLPQVTEAPPESEPGPDLGITVNGKFVSLPPEATIITGQPDFVEVKDPGVIVRFGGSEVTFKRSGILIASSVQPQDAEALQPLLDALRPE